MYVYICASTLMHMCVYIQNKNEFRSQMVVAQGLESHQSDL